MYHRFLVLGLGLCVWPLVAAPLWAGENNIEPTPPALVEKGAIHTGFFQSPFRQVNLLDAPNFGGADARQLRRMRLKEWVGFSVASPEVYGAMIIQDAKYAASGTLYLYDHASKQKYEWLVVDLPWRVQLPESLWAGESRARKGKSEMRFRHDLDHGQHVVTLNLAAHGTTPAATAHLVLHEDLSQVDPLVVSLPIEPDHHTYTHKAPLRLEGTLTVGDKTYTFDPKRDLGNIDEQKTFYPYRSHWYWGTFVAPSTEGREVMLNFVDQMTPKGQPGEDALWVDGKLELIPQPQIIALDTPGNYRIEGPDGKVKLTFTAEGSIAVERNFLVVAMDYQQYFGRYSGEITDAAGHTHRFENVFGALERMNARF